MPSTSRITKAGITLVNQEVSFSVPEKTYSSLVYVPQGMCGPTSAKLPKDIFNCAKISSHIAHVLYQFCTQIELAERLGGPSLLHLYAHWFPVVRNGTWIEELKFHLCQFFAKESEHLDDSLGGLPTPPDDLVHKEGYFLPAKYMRYMRCLIHKNSESIRSIKSADSILFSILNGLKKGMPSVPKERVDREVLATICDLASFRDQPFSRELDDTIRSFCADDRVRVTAARRRKFEQDGVQLNVTRGACTQSGYPYGGGMGFLYREACVGHDEDSGPVQTCVNASYWATDGGRDGSENPVREEVEDLRCNQMDWFVTFWRQEIIFLLSGSYNPGYPWVAGEGFEMEPREILGSPFGIQARLDRLNEVCKRDNSLSSDDLFVWVRQKDSTRLEIQVNEKANVVEFVGVKEPLKVRPISKGNFFLNSLWHDIQKSSWANLKRLPQFSLIGEPMTETHVEWLWRESCYSYDRGQLWEPSELMFCSGDYKGATNTIFQWVTESVIDSLFEETWVKKLVTGNMCRTTLCCPAPRSSDDRVTCELLGGSIRDKKLFMPQRLGQLMGSLFSFPILCVINYAVNSLFLKRVNPDRRYYRDPLSYPLLVNGDDNLSLFPKWAYPTWQFCIGLAGFRMSIGKNYLAREILYLNSKYFRFDRENGTAFEVPYLNSGILFGEKKTAAREELNPSVDERANAGYAQTYRQQAFHTCNMDKHRELLSGRTDLPRGVRDAWSFAMGGDAVSGWRKVGWVGVKKPGRPGALDELLAQLRCNREREETQQQIEGAQLHECYITQLPWPAAGSAPCHDDEHRFVRTELRRNEGKMAKLLGRVVEVHGETVAPWDFCCAHCQEFEDILRHPTYQGQAKELNAVPGKCLSTNTSRTITMVAAPEEISGSDSMLDYYQLLPEDHVVMF